MKEKIITVKTAKLAKNKGFYIRGINRFNHKDGSTVLFQFVKSIKKEYLYDNLLTIRCTQSLLQKWLREKHNILVTVIPFMTYSNFFNGYYSTIVKNNKLQKETKVENLYEKSLEEGLQEALKMI